VSGAWRAVLVGLVALLSASSTAAQAQVPDGEWHAFGRDAANTKYSPLDQITADKFTDLRIYDYMDRPPNMGWRHRGLTYWKDSESDDARIFMANHDLKLIALHARTGEMKWTFHTISQGDEFGVDS